MQTADQFRTLIETEILKIIQKLSRDSSTEEEKLRQIASIALELIKPGMSIEELYQNAVKLDDKEPALAPVVFFVMKEYEKTHEKKALDVVSSLIRNGKYDDAQHAVKKVLEFKIHN
ncbi:MAG: hypothetical protein AAB966_04245 [Patescibacteria group bacterium]